MKFHSFLYFVMNFGELTKTLITDIPLDFSDTRYQELKKSLVRFPKEAIYIYSFKENRMIYADGWEEVLGYKDNEITMLKIVSCTTPQFYNFSNEMNDKSMMFLKSITEHHEEYSFTIELKKFHKNGTEVPLISRVGVHKAENGQLTEIIGRSLVNTRLKFGKVMNYEAFGPNVVEFEELLSKSLFREFFISGKEKEALSLMANGLTYKEVADKLFVSSSAVQKRVLPLFERFEVKSLPHLISFAYQNGILP